MFVRQERCDLAMREDCRHHLARHLGGQQPVTVLVQSRRDPDEIVDAKVYETAEHQVVIHLLHQLAFRPDGEQYLHKACPDQPFRGDRGTTEVDVQRHEIGIQTDQRLVY